ncbi:MAG: hypothetical protein KDE14_00945 [Rhodobacteraceae bacterium]|nr:hypothetical protein [Paracoccaceae bacterium]
MSTEQYARVIVFKEGETLFAQCLEYDICAHAQDEQTLYARFKALFNFERNLSIERNGAPFAGLDKAPQKFHDMWDACVLKENFAIASTHLSLAKCA